MVRAKFTCTGKEGDNVLLTPVYGDNPENEAFFKATPGGSISLNVVNESALNALEVGKDYYVDFTPATQPEAATA